MSRIIHRIPLSLIESLCLKDALPVDDESVSFIRAALADFADGMFLEIDHETAETLREHLTNQLAKTGFDEDYELTKKGAMIESLIDRLYFSRV